MALELSSKEVWAALLQTYAVICTVTIAIRQTTWVAVLMDTWYWPSSSSVVRPSIITYYQHCQIRLCPCPLVCTRDKLQTNGPTGHWSPSLLTTCHWNKIPDKISKSLMLQSCKVKLKIKPYYTAPPKVIIVVLSLE